MHLDSCFTRFKSSISEIDLPERFTFPFYYEPHALAIKASEELQEYLEENKHNLNQYGLGKANQPSYGKMYGVLVVKDRDEEIGYLSAYSGEIYERSAHARFVPPLYDKFAPDSYFFQNCEPLNLSLIHISEPTRPY